MSELHFNSPEQVAGYLSDALEIVETLELSDDLRAIAFTKAVELLSAKQVAVDAAAFAPPILRGSPTMPGVGGRGH